MTQTDRVDGFIGDSAIKAPVRAATTAAITLSGEQTIDGVALVTGDRCLVKNQASSITNGIYVVDSGAWSRSSDFDGTYDVVTGTIVKVNSGSASAGLFYELTTTGDITIGTSALVFAVVSPSSPLTLPLALSQGGTGINAESAAEALASLGVVQCTAVGGTADAITCTIDDAVTAYHTNQIFALTPTGTNTGAATLTPTPDGGVALAGKNILRHGAACVAGDIKIGVPVLLLYDGVQFNLIGHSQILTSGTLAGTTNVSGGQIKFPAAQNASADANTLDDYEEGTWTPSVGGTATYTIQSGKYTKIGRLVFFVGAITINTIGTGSTTTVSGLPFVAAEATPVSTGSSVSLATNVVSINAIVGNGLSQIIIASRTVAAANDGLNALFGNGTSINFAGCYHV